MLIPFLISLVLLTVSSTRSIQREVWILRKKRRGRHQLMFHTMRNLGWDPQVAPGGKHRLKDTPRAHRHCTEHDPCAYKVRHLKGIPATTLIREAEEEQKAWEDAYRAQEEYLSQCDTHTLTGLDAQPYYNTYAAA